jgi:fructose-1,6-bisphosphatase/inositol monophosphatase family enzyme
MSSSAPSVNLLDMASSVLASAVASSLSIRAFAQPSDGDNDSKNARLKPDGTFVTDADFAAQSIITSAVRRVSANVRILGEESPETVAKIPNKELEHESDLRVQANCRRELYLRFKNRNQPLSASLPMPLASSSSDNSTPANDVSFELSEEEKKEVVVDVSRVCVIIDPLDGTSSYAKGLYDVVSILISVNLDYQPHFGVICKPFGYDGLPSIMDLKCAAVYGGPLIGGGFIAGAEALKGPSHGSQSTYLPRAVISSSRSKGVVEDVCQQLGSLGVIHPEPLHISGAGEKSLRLVLRRNDEGLWFFPREGTSLWDIAASDAILRSLGGKVTDKHGRPLDYSKSRDDADNVDGIIACSDHKLHAECMRVFKEGNWEE